MAKPGRLVLARSPPAREGVASLRVMLGAGGGRNRQSHNPQPGVTRKLLASQVHPEEASLRQKMSD